MHVSSKIGSRGTKRRELIFDKGLFFSGGLVQTGVEIRKR